MAAQTPMAAEQGGKSLRPSGSGDRPTKPGPGSSGDGIGEACDPAPGPGRADLDGNGIADLCEADCDANGRPDGADVASGESPDCDGNGIPDRCDLEDLDAVDCQGNGVPDRCDLSLGTSADRNFDGRPDECQADCNGNGLPDDFDLLQGKSLDLDTDGRPDECAPDCNGNGLPDAFDLAQGLSADCQGNGVPDECDISLGASLDGSGLADSEFAGSGLTGSGQAGSGLTGSGLEGTGFGRAGDGVPDECQPRCEAPCEGRASRVSEEKPYPIVYSLEEDPIPEGFFSAGSAPFAGRLQLVGQPLDRSRFGLADLLIHRSADPFSPRDPFGGEPVAVGLEARGLLWKGLTPISVLEGTTERSWTVEAGLSPARPSRGGLEAWKTHPGGGYADLELGLELRFVFRRLDDPLEVRVLDAPALDRPPFLVSASRIPWRHELELPGPEKGETAGRGEFFLGVDAPGAGGGQHFVPVLGEASLGQLCTVLCAVPAPQLEIFNGLEGACRDPIAGGPCGGQAVPNKIADGAVTVANLNDTDGNGQVDRDDPKVTALGGKGRDEVDLMKIVIDVVPNPNDNTMVDLAVTGDALIWDQKTKGGRSRARDSFATKELPKTLWIEARSASRTLRDLGVALTYAGQTDSARATAVWAELSEVRRTRTLARPANGIPGDLAGTPLERVIEFFRAADGSRYGIGSFKGRTAGDQRIGGRILFQLTTRPKGAEALGVRWDMTRQIFGRDREILSGGDRLTVPARLPDVDFPERGRPAKDIELPTDDSNPLAEADTPVNQHIYSFDAPSGGRGAGAKAFEIRREQFREWARVRIEPNGTFVNLNGVVEGSRASPFIPWSFIDYLRRTPDGRLDADSRNPSASAPRIVAGGDGRVAVDVLPSAVTESFVATYLRGTWRLTASKGPLVTRTLAEPVAPGGQWVLEVPGKVRVTITQGGRPFRDFDLFLFSTFKAKAAGAKQSVIVLGAIDPQGEE